MRRNLIIFLLIAFPLAGCVSREDADVRLEKGCKAGVEIFLSDGFKIKEVKNVVAKTSAEFGSGFRDVTLTAVESDGWVDYDKEYKCIFAEETDMLGTYHRATIYQIKVDGQVYGQSGNQILGDSEVIARMAQTVEQALDE